MGTPKITDLVILINDLEGKNIFIHCAQGYGRTGLVTIALLLRQGIIKEVDDGIFYLKSFRPALDLSPQQIKFLRKYKDKFLKK